MRERVLRTIREGISSRDIVSQFPNNECQNGGKHQAQTRHTEKENVETILIVDDKISPNIIRQIGASRNKITKTVEGGGSYFTIEKTKQYRDKGIEVEANENHGNHD